MEKTDVVASLGQMRLLLPAWIKAALAANDRLKFYLTILQAAQAHADQPSGQPLDLKREYVSARIDAPWILDMPSSAWAEGAVLHVAELQALAKRLREDLRLMARPVEGSPEPSHQALCARTDFWCAWLDQLATDAIDADQMRALTSGKRGGEDSFHLLVMDLHKSLNQLVSDVSDDMIEGAHVWQLTLDDRPSVEAFMRGLNRTRPLKFEHPGLDTAATRDGDRLLIQNDIGTNDAHVLVIQVEGRVVTLTYSDLHDRRFAFFQDLLAEIGAQWSGVTTRESVGLNAGAAYFVGTARFDCGDDAALDRTLEGVGARIVFLIDWNHARKRLNLFVPKPISVAVLRECARREKGHMGWLAAGGETLIFGAMEMLGRDHFRIGDRLDAVLGAAHAQDFLIEALTLASDAMSTQQAPTIIADSIRLLLLRHIGRHHDEFALLGEHAAFCHALAEGVRDALAYGHERDLKAAQKLADRAKTWERKADHLVMSSRDQSQRNPRWQPFLRLIEQADDCADGLEEAAFILSLIAEDRHKGWNDEVRSAMRLLADKVLEATQDHVKAVAVARTLTETSSSDDQEEFLSVCWRVVNAERQCDSLMREVRRKLSRHVDDAATLCLGTDFASALEGATDALLRTGYAMRELAFARVGARS